MRADPPSHHIFSDAGLTGWGSHLEPEGLLYRGVLSKTQVRLHINILEMMAISLTLRKALQFIKNSTVLISTDNTTVVAYLNRQGVGGGGTFTRPLCGNLENSNMVPSEPNKSSDKTHSWEIQCPSRSIKQNNQTDLNRL